MAVNILPLRVFSFLPDQDVCKLYCFAEGYDFFFALASKVKDGTLCSQDSSNVCIDGLCEVILLNVKQWDSKMIWLMHDFSARFSEDDIICGVFKVEQQHSRVDSAVEKISAVMFFTSFLNVMKEEKLTCQHIAKG